MAESNAELGNKTLKLESTGNCLASVPRRVPLYSGCCFSLQFINVMIRRLFLVPTASVAWVVVFSLHRV